MAKATRACTCNACLYSCILHIHYCICTYCQTTKKWQQTYSIKALEFQNTKIFKGKKGSSEILYQCGTC